MASVPNVRSRWRWMAVSDNDTERPKRDVSARAALGECTHCGGNAQSTLGGEHIWKCSEIVTEEAAAESRRRIEKVMALLMDGAPLHSIELQLQHAHANLDGEKDDLYRHVETDTDRREE